MSADVRIVAFDPQYAADFARLNYAWITALFAVEPPDRRILDNPDREIIAHGGQIFFALKGDQVVGTVALNVESATTFELTKMAVDETQRGSGYGKLLLDFAIAHARAKGAKQLVLSSHTSLNAAIAMYRKAGFVNRDTCADSCYSRCDVFMRLDLVSP